MKRGTMELISRLVTINENRDEIIAVCVAAALQPMHIHNEYSSEFYTAHNWLAVDNLLNDINEHVLLDMKKTARDIRDAWEARMISIFRPFNKLETDNYWDKFIPEMKKKDLQMCSELTAIIKQIV